MIRPWKSIPLSSIVWVLLAGCSSPPATTNPDGDGNGGTGGGPQGRHRLTIHWLGDGFGTTFQGAAVWVFVADETILRSEGVYSVSLNTHMFIRSQNDPRTTGEYDVEDGKSVTLVAFEDAGKILNLFAGAVAPDPKETTQIEFVEWGGDIDATPEEGVATILMNADKEVTVRFDPMPTVTISVQGLGQFLHEIQAPVFLNHPSFEGVSPTTDCFDDECELPCLGGPAFGGEALHYALKGGTIVKLISLDCIANQYDWSMWTKAGCGDRECSFQLGADGDAEAIWIEK